MIQEEVLCQVYIPLPAQGRSSAEPACPLVSVRHSHPQVSICSLNILSASDTHLPNHEWPTNRERKSLKGQLPSSPMEIEA